MRRLRAAERNIELPPISNPSRRRRCVRNIFRFCETYFSETFWADWTKQRRQMVQAILTAATYGGDQAIAAPRGEGKTSITEAVVVYCVLVGLVRVQVGARLSEVRLLSAYLVVSRRPPGGGHSSHSLIRRYLTRPFFLWYLE